MLNGVYEGLIIMFQRRSLFKKNSLGQQHLISVYTVIKRFLVQWSAGKDWLFKKRMLADINWKYG